MIKTTISRIFNAMTVLQRLSNKELPVKVSYSLAKVIKAASAELATYDGQRIKLCEQYGKLNEDGSEYEIDEARRSEFEAKADELINLAVEIDVKPVKLPDDVKLKAQEILLIEDFIEVVGCD